METVSCDKENSETKNRSHKNKKGTFAARRWPLGFLSKFLLKNSESKYTKSLVYSGLSIK